MEAAWGEASPSPPLNRTLVYVCGGGGCHYYVIEQSVTISVQSEFPNCNEYTKCPSEYAECPSEYTKCTSEYAECTSEYAECPSKYTKCVSENTECPSPTR